MNTSTLLQDLAARGVTLAANGDHLDIDGPDGMLTDDLLDTLRERKAELLTLLRSESETGAEENTETRDSALFAGEPVEVCPICHGKLTERAGKDFRHLWCPRRGHFDAWRTLRGLKLSGTDAPIIRERVEEAL